VLQQPPFLLVIRIDKDIEVGGYGSLQVLQIPVDLHERANNDPSGSY
jgi:hypothetical protein